MRMLLIQAVVYEGGGMKNVLKRRDDEVKKRRENSRTRTDKQSFLLRAFPSYDFGQSSNTYLSYPLSYSNRSIAVGYGTIGIQAQDAGAHSIPG